MSGLAVLCHVMYLLMSFCEFCYMSILGMVQFSYRISHYGFGFILLKRWAIYLHFVYTFAITLDTYIIDTEY